MIFVTETSPYFDKFQQTSLEEAHEVDCDKDGL